MARTVSEAAHATPAPGENHGQQVREVARDNRGHEDKPDDQGKPEDKGQAGGRPGKPEDKGPPEPPAADNSGKGQGGAKPARRR